MREKEQQLGKNRIDYRLGEGWCPGMLAVTNQRLTFNSRYVTLSTPIDRITSVHLYAKNDFLGYHWELHIQPTGLFKHKSHDVCFSIANLIDEVHPVELNLQRNFVNTNYSLKEP
jgi:hypothetical protein